MPVSAVGLNVQIADLAHQVSGFDRHCCPGGCWREEFIGG
jgi:hypothetical protein